MNEMNTPRSGCCTCPGSDLAADEIEILHSGSSGTFAVEEEALPEEEPPLDLKRMQLSLLCMKSLIGKYQLKLKAYLDPCPEEPCVDYEVELTCSKNEEICALQRMQYKLKCQIDELVACCRVAKQEFHNLQSLMCEKSKQIFDVQKHMGALESWRRKLENEAGLCIERFEYLKHVKAEWSDVVELLDKQKKCCAKTEENLVPKKCYLEDKTYFLEEIRKLRQMFTELYELQSNNVTYFCGPDTPPRGAEFKLAETEYMELKKKINEQKNDKEEQ